MAMKRRVLVVEDNLDAVQSMTRLIRMMGHDVAYAMDGLGALEAARRFRPQVILLDIGLPDFNGHNIARQLKWEPSLARTRIIAITGQPLHQIRQKALDAGCEDVFAKPMDPKVLEEVIRG
jgi:CheY-like chemotaxis protein